MIVNVWLVLRNDAQDAIVTRLKWDEEKQGEYTGPVNDQAVRIFRCMADLDNVQRMFKVPTIARRRYTLYSVNFNQKGSMLQKVKDELDWLVNEYPNRLFIAGVWHWDGRQIGTHWTDDKPPVITGTPTYPLHARLIDFMPDIVTWDQDGKETNRVSATELTDVNLSQGQRERRF